MQWRWSLLAYTVGLAVLVLVNLVVDSSTIWIGTAGVVGLSAVVGWWAGELIDNSRPPLVVLLGLVSILVILGFAALNAWTILPQALTGAGAGFLIERSTLYRPASAPDGRRFSSTNEAIRHTPQEIGLERVRAL